MVDYPQLVFGSGTIGSEFAKLERVEDVEKLLDTLEELGIHRLDTTPRHPPGHDHLAEQLYGQAGVSKRGFAVDIKNYFGPAGTAGTLSLESVRASVPASLKRLGIEKANVFYCYFPDLETQLEEQVAAVDEQYHKGAFEKYGLSNFAPEMVEDWMAICGRTGAVKPSVYQGLYNIVSREAETTLFPLLRSHGMTFAAFSVLGGGFLSGNFTAGKAENTRLAEENPMGKFFRSLYDKPEFHQAVKDLHNLLEPHGIGSTEAAIRWVCYHSALGNDDAIILGASRTDQVQKNVDDLQKGPLPEQVLTGLDEMWKTLAAV